jgi:hypothetical protein
MYVISSGINQRLCHDGTLPTALDMIVISIGHEVNKNHSVKFTEEEESLLLPIV